MMDLNGDRSVGLELAFLELLPGSLSSILSRMIKGDLF